MKKPSLFDNILHFLVHNSFLFTTVIMCLVHATLLTITFFAGLTPLFYINILSVIVYLFCIVLCKFGHIMPVYISILLEVSVYAILSIYYIGWESSAYCFLFAIVPIIIYFGCFLFKGSKRWAIVVILALDFMLFITLSIINSVVKPIYDLSYMTKMVMMIFSNFVMFFSIIFYNTIYIYSSESEMNSLEERNVQLSADAKEDSLTHLLNRRGFLPVVQQLMDEGEQNQFCIAFCDIDNFKRINDSYGHDCGDEVLRHISKLFTKEMSDCEICRWGGEEIVILLKEADYSLARDKMEYLRKVIEYSPTIFYNKRIPATITIGVAQHNDSCHEPEDVIKVADARMYYGKQHGKNIVISEDAIAG